MDTNFFGVGGSRPRASAFGAPVVIALLLGVFSPSRANAQDVQFDRVIIYLGELRTVTSNNRETIEKFVSFFPGLTEEIPRQNAPGRGGIALLRFYQIRVTFLGASGNYVQVFVNRTNQTWRTPESGPDRRFVRMDEFLAKVDDVFRSASSTPVVKGIVEPGAGRQPFVIVDENDLTKIVSHFPTLGRRFYLGAQPEWDSDLIITFIEASNLAHPVKVNLERGLWNEGHGDWPLENKDELVALLEQLAQGRSTDPAPATEPAPAGAP
jgi:hypothetical protein